MKKIFAIIMTISLVVIVLCVTAFAADPSADTVIRVRAQKSDGSIVEIEKGDYKYFSKGWEAAVNLAENSDLMNENGYVRVVVDLYSDWNANSMGKFGSNSYAGFQYNTIYVPQNVSMMINMNGHTINRGLDGDKKDGEVMYVDKRADVIINGGKNGDPILKPGEKSRTVKMGTVTGGNSYNGAGGIHINDNATLTLNNVRVVGNRVEDSDGSAIAAYDGARLIMNGGSISNNVLYNSENFFGASYGALYLKKSSAALTEVEISHNGIAGFSSSWGVAIYVDDSDLKMENCFVTKNGYKGGSEDFLKAYSIIRVDGTSGVLDIINCKFEKNGTEGVATGPDLLEIYEGTVKMSDSFCKNNFCTNIIYSEDGVVEVTDSRFEGNIGSVFEGNGKTGSHFTGCAFSKNTSVEGYKTFNFGKGNLLAFNDCDFGDDTTFNDRSRATFDGVAGVGSIFGTGSLNTVVSLLALVVSLAAIGVSVASNKKKAASSSEDNE